MCFVVSALRQVQGSVAQSDPGASLGEQDREGQGWAEHGAHLDPPGAPLLWGCAEPQLGLSSPSERQQNRAEAQGWFRATLLPGCWSPKYLLGHGVGPAETPEGPAFPAALLELLSTNSCARRGRKLLSQKVLW